MIPTNPVPSKMMQWSMEFWRRVLLGLEKVNEDVTEIVTPDADATARHRKDEPPRIW